MKTGRKSSSKPRLTSGPTATRRGKNVSIEFSVSTATDCAVKILSPNGKVVRHLGAGVLGKDAPPPLKKNSLKQRLTWNCLDDRGEQVDPADCRVVVELGLRARFDSVIGHDPQWLGEIHALAVGPRGRLYALTNRGICVLGRDGKYIKQIAPAPANLPISKLKGLEPVKLPDGSTYFNRDYQLPAKMKYVGSMAITANGQILLPGPENYSRNLTRIGIDGSVAKGAFDTKLTALADNGYLYLAVTPDGKTLFISGAEAGYRGDDLRKVGYRQSVYRLDLDSQGPAETLVGDDECWGGPGTAMNWPKGVATDSKGNLYVCNYGGNNIAVYSQRGSLLRSIKVKHPQQVAVHPRNGKLYVLAGKEEGYNKYDYDFEPTMLEARLLRISAAGKLERRLKLKHPYVRKTITRPGPSYQLRFAADFTGKRAIMWVGLAAPGAHLAKWNLLRVEDGARGFSKPVDVCARPKDALLSPAMQVTLDRERDLLYVHDRHGEDDLDRLVRFSGEGEYLKPLFLKNPGKTEPYYFAEIALGPDGNIYTFAWEGRWGTNNKTFLARFTPSGKPLPFPEGTDLDRKLKRVMKGARGHSSRGITVSPRGEVHVLYYDPARPQEGREGWEIGWHLNTALASYSAEGLPVNLKLISYLRSGANCVRLDSRGNIYVGDNTMPLGVGYPSEMARALPDPLKRDYPARIADGSFDPLLRWMGSVIRFGSGGGEIVGLPESDRTRPAKKQRGDLWKPVPKTQWFLQNDQRVKITGAQWQYHGFAPLPAQYQGVTHVERCVCRGGRFDLDQFDRVFVPDNRRHQVTVLDSAGNVITKFGSYGNQDSAGKRLGLADPWWITAAADRIYVGDGYACRIVKVKLMPTSKGACKID